MHELVHGLGPHGITVGGRATTVRQELKETYSAIEEAKADIAGLFALQFLVDKGQLAKDFERTMYTTFLASAFRSIRFGITEAHGRGQAVQLNYLLDQGAFTVNADGTFAVAADKIREAVTALTREIMTLQAEGQLRRGQDHARHAGRGPAADPGRARPAEGRARGHRAALPDGGRAAGGELTRPAGRTALTPVADDQRRDVGLAHHPVGDGADAVGGAAARHHQQAGAALAHDGGQARGNRAAAHVDRRRAGRPSLAASAATLPRAASVDSSSAGGIGHLADRPPHRQRALRAHVAEREAGAGGLGPRRGDAGDGAVVAVEADGGDDVAEGDARDAAGEARRVRACTRARPAPESCVSRITPSVVEPNTSLRAPPRPCVPITMRSASARAAALRISGSRLAGRRCRWPERPAA